LTSTTLPSSRRTNAVRCAAVAHFRLNNRSTAGVLERSLAGLLESRPGQGFVVVTAHGDNSAANAASNHDDGD
jgi:hypothetical protein